MGATLQYLFYNAVVSVGSTLVTLGAAYKLFGERLIERLFGHILDGRLQKEKERHELALANLKHEQPSSMTSGVGDSFPGSPAQARRNSRIRPADYWPPR
jgi:hypothetical protein